MDESIVSIPISHSKWMEKSKRNQTIKSHRSYGTLMFRVTLLSCKIEEYACDAVVWYADTRLQSLFVVLCPVTVSSRRHKPLRSSTQVTYPLTCSIISCFVRNAQFYAIKRYAESAKQTMQENRRNLQASQLSHFVQTALAERQRQRRNNVECLSMSFLLTRIAYAGCNVKGVYFYVKQTGLIIAVNWNTHHPCEVSREQNKVHLNTNTSRVRNHLLKP